MKVSSSLPPIPRILLRRVDLDHEPAPFLQLQRVWLCAQFPDGSESAAFGYDSVTRRALDAVVIVAWRRIGGEVAVYLRTSVRPPLQERRTHPGAADRAHQVCMWELPAGLIEPEDLEGRSDGDSGIRRTAARETAEELGFQLPPERFELLGAGVFPAPAMTAERQFFAHVEVREDLPSTPSLDGSPLEEHAAICLLPLEKALEYCHQGLIVDGKTELALRRLAARLKGEG